MTKRPLSCIEVIVRDFMAGLSENLKINRSVKSSLAKPAIVNLSRVQVLSTLSLLSLSA